MSRSALLPARTLALGLLVLLIGCTPVSPAQSPSAGQSAPPSVLPSAASSAGDSALADALRDAIDLEDILADLDELQAIADRNDGVRAAGTQGHMESAGFVAEELRQAGFEVTMDTFDVPLFSDVDPGAIQIQRSGAPTFTGPRDFKAMLFSASGDLTARVFALGFNPNAAPGDRNGLGCDADDWADVPAGMIVLAQPGPCRRRQAVEHAQEAGALALITSYPDWTRDRVLRPTLLFPDGIEIPVVGTTGELGLALNDAATRGDQVRLAIHTSIIDRTTANVIAETPGGDASHVLVVGGHLDSVIDGPGINDNGSGTMTVLEIARELAALTEGEPGWKVRVAFWSGEELGLHGSFAYTDALSTDDRHAIAAYLNFDMLGSPNGVRLVYDAEGATKFNASRVIQEAFERALTDDGLSFAGEDIGGGSDHAPFDENQIPIGGLFSGANGIKSAEEAGLFGGTAGQPEDPCYHLPCDTPDNVDPVLLEQMARAAAWVVGLLASGTVTLPIGD